ncbi:MAG: cupredoxin domain-containing protein [archaeon]
MNTKLIIAMFAVAALLLSACTTTDNTVAKPSVKLIDEDPSTPVQDLSMNIIIGTFEPNQITVKKDMPVRLKLTSTEIDPKFETHGFAVKELGIDVSVAKGATEIVEFTPDKVGDFVFYCSVYCGQGHVGQTGILHVIE